MDSVALRVRDRVLIRTAVQQAYGDVRLASGTPPQVMTQAIVEAMWETRLASSKEAFGGIMRAVGKLMKLLQKAPRIIPRLMSALAIEGWSDLSWPQRASALGNRLKELMKEGRSFLGKAMHKAAQSFPLSLFFVDRSKMPGLSDLLQRLTKNVPWLQDALQKVNAGAMKVDQLFQKYLPKLRRPIYAAIFIWVWLNVAELSWDLQGLLAGFTGQISLSELLASMPESGIGFIAAAFGLGYGALPYVMIARLVWLISQQYLSYVPGKGIEVYWAKLGIRQRSELVPA